MESGLTKILGLERIGLKIANMHLQSKSDYKTCTFHPKSNLKHALSIQNSQFTKQ